MSEIITKRHDQIIHHFNLISNITKKMQLIAKDNRPFLNGERYITDRELSTIIKISRRTIQQWRTDGIVTYIIFSGKTLYRESDIQKLLEKHYHKSL